MDEVDKICMNLSCKLADCIKVEQGYDNANYKSINQEVKRVRIKKQESSPCILSNLSLEAISPGKSESGSKNNSKRSKKVRPPKPRPPRKSVSSKRESPLIPARNYEFEPRSSVVDINTIDGQ